MSKLPFSVTEKVWSVTELPFSMMKIVLSVTEKVLFIMEIPFFLAENT